MKKILLLISVLSLFAYGCNRDQQEPAGGGTDLQQEEQFENTDVEAVEPAMQEESDMQRMDESEPVLESDPALESDPGMQEEQSRFPDSETMDSDTAPVSEPMDDTEIQQ